MPAESAESLGHCLRDAAVRGAALLTDHARAGLAAALRDDWLPAGLARGRNGNPDLYYTLFTVFACDALEVSFDEAALRAALDTREPRLLDGVHRACLLCLQARVGVNRGRLRRRLLCELTPAALTRLGDPYEMFVWSLATEACGWQPPWFLLSWWAPWNWMTTPQAAAVLTAQSLAGSALRRGERAATWLLARRADDGGFRASPGAPESDLLSTATAAFSLALSGWRGNETDILGLTGFVEACRPAAGHWSDRAGGGDCDAEYSFYALLALGSAVMP